MQAHFLELKKESLLNQTNPISKIDKASKTYKPIKNN
jgi:hypothetical protein